MTSKKNKACTLKVGEIEKNPILALSTSEEEVEKYTRVTKTYGNVAPVIVGQNGKNYRLLTGQARLEACARNMIKELPVIVADTDNEAEQMKLALLLSTVQEEGGPLSEGAFIDALITDHGVARRDLMDLLNKSKSWISKRQSLAAKLSDVVKGMVKDGTVCARSAEEIAKLPEVLQVTFASNVVRDGLSKTNVEQLVSLFIREKDSPALRKTILETPLAALEICNTKTTSQRKKKKKGRSEAERIVSNASFLIRLVYELKGLLATVKNQSLNLVKADLNELHIALADLQIALNMKINSVSPGELKEGELNDRN